MSRSLAPTTGHTTTGHTTTGHTATTPSSPVPTRAGATTTTRLAPATTVPRSPTTAPPRTPTPPSPAGDVAGAPASDWLAYHQGGSAFPIEARLGEGAPTPSLTDPHVAWRAGLPAGVYAEPLAADGLVLVATEADTVVALRATTGSEVWSVALGTPVARPADGLACGDIDPLGITSTPVIDPSRNELFVVGEVQAAPGAEGISFVLAGIAIPSGQVVLRRSVVVPGMDVGYLQQRAGLALAGGRVLIGFGGVAGDCNAYHGYVVSAPESGLGPVDAFEVASLPGDNGGAVWAPSGPAVADGPGGPVAYVATGNSAYGRPGLPYDDSDGVLALTPAMHLVSFFAPSDWPALSAHDADLGSTGPTLLPGGLVFEAGKSLGGVTTAFLLRASALGGIGGAIAATQICVPGSGGVFGGTAEAGGIVYVPCTSGLQAVAAGVDGLRVLWQGPSGAVGPPVLAGGLVWSIGTSTGLLYGLDPATGALLVALPVGPVEHFATPTPALGLLVVPTSTGVVAFSA